MKKLKMEKLQRKHKFYKCFNQLTRAAIYLPVCILIGLASSFMFSALWAKLLWTICACISWDVGTRVVWGKAKKKAKNIEQEMAEYAETEQGEKEVVLMANIEAVKEILQDKECKIRPTCERLLERLIETKYTMANKPKIKCEDTETGNVVYGEIIGDGTEEIDLEDLLYKSAEESGFFNTEEE